jgi:dolichol-phosphate mannosyltransferase
MRYPSAPTSNLDPPKEANVRSIVVTPTYNERDNIVNMIEAVLAVPGDFDCLIVDDNSPDGTADLVAPYLESTNRVHLIRRAGPRGFGPSYIDGFEWCLDRGYDAVFTMDADFSHDPASLPDLSEALRTSDVAVGSRYCGGRVSVVNWPLSRLLMSTFAGKYVRMITGLRVPDPTSGFRAFKSAVLDAVSPDTVRSNGYCFLVETLLRVKRCGFTISEVPIVFTERRDGQSKMSRKIILEAALMPWLLRLRPFKADKRRVSKAAG